MSPDEALRRRVRSCTLLRSVDRLQPRVGAHQRPEPGRMPPAVAMQQAIAAGATIRDAIQVDEIGRNVASLFDPFGHIWALVERKAERASLAA